MGGRPVLKLTLVMLWGEKGTSVGDSCGVKGIWLLAQSPLTFPSWDGMLTGQEAQTRQWGFLPPACIMEAACGESHTMALKEDSPLWPL